MRDGVYDKRLERLSGPLSAEFINAIEQHVARMLEQQELREDESQKLKAAKGLKELARDCRHLAFDALKLHATLCAALADYKVTWIQRRALQNTSTMVIWYSDTQEKSNDQGLRVEFCVFPLFEKVTYTGLPKGESKQLYRSKVFYEQEL